MVGMHDIVMDEIPPQRKPYLISRVDDRIGTNYVPCDPDKIIAIVESEYEDNGFPLSTPDAASTKIAENILDFLEMEVKSGRLPKNLLPMQSGAGNIANAIVAGLLNCKFEDLQVWTEVLQDNFLDFFDSGKLSFASACSLSLSVPGAKRFYQNLDQYKHKV
jgi:acetyl-CoA hydrolase